MAFNYSPKIVTDGLVLYLDAANNRSYPGSGTTWTDLSRGSNNGTLTNGPTFNSANGGSIVFDGINDYVNCGTTDIIPGSWTINVWVQQKKTTGAAVFFGRSGTAPNYDQTAILGWIATGNKFFTQGKTVGGIYSSTTSSFSPSTTVIYNVVGTFNTASTALNLYINGVLDNTKVIGSLFTTGSNLSNQVGCSDGTIPGNFTQGNLYSVQIYNRALSSTEVLQNYNATKTRFGLI